MNRNTKMKINKTIASFILLQFVFFSSSLPLSTNSRWIVDDATGERVKLACVNWASHLEPMIAEGLEKKPLNYIAKQIAAFGFNCVRFTWATFMFTRPDYGNLTVSQSLDKLGLANAKAGIAKNNPHFLNMSVVEVHKVVVNELGKNQLMVILDNHISKPQWCCKPTDGNGFFGDPSFDPNEWLEGLKTVARTYKDNSAVVGMSLRNELRGHRQNIQDWHKYMEKGAVTVHRENPDVLVIISGLSADKDLSFLKKKPFGVKIENKLVFEAHSYALGRTVGEWVNQTNQKCSATTRLARNSYLFLTEGNKPFPLFLSEFGLDERGKNEAHNRFIACLFAILAENDLDCALWTFQGSYIHREGKINLEEVYGVMDFNWDQARNAFFIQRVQFIRHINQGTKSTRPTSNIMYHPLSGQCVKSRNNNMILDDCKTASRWDRHENGNSIKLEGSQQCLGVAEGGVAITNDCTSNKSKWKSVSISGLHLAAEDEKVGYLCLEKNASDSTLVANKCLCLTSSFTDVPSCDQNPQTQWFKFVPTNVQQRS